MTIPATAVWEIQSSGSDTANGGSFDTASTGKPTDLTCTAGTGNTTTPEVSSASYNFVPGDVGHWLFVQGGTNWTPGWYKISSVTSNKATVNATIGAAVLTNGSRSTVAGVATTGTPTAGVWAVDYSQVASVPFSLTGLSTTTTSAVLLTSSATKAMVGNGLIITGGTNFTAGYYTVVAAVAGTSLTVDRTATAGVGSAGTAGLGGALASPGKVAGTQQGSNKVWVAAATYLITSTTVNVAGGRLSTAGTNNADPGHWRGYTTIRGDGAPTRPILQASGAFASQTLVTIASEAVWEGIDVDGNSKTAVLGISASGQVIDTKVSNCTNGGVSLFSGYRVEVTGCSGGNGALYTNAAGTIWYCSAHDNTVYGFHHNSTVQTTMAHCLSWNNTGANGIGFRASQSGLTLLNCLAYGNAQAGFLHTGGSQNRSFHLINCLAVNNGTFGFTNGTSPTGARLWNCAGYNNPSGNYAATFLENLNFHALTADPFVAAGSQNFALTSVAGGGGDLRAAGYPTTWPGASGSMINYLDIGAAQHADPAGASVLGNWIGLV